MLKAHLQKKRVEAAGLALVETGFDALCWLYQFRKMRVLERLNMREGQRDDAMRRLDAAIADLETALTRAGVDLENSTFVDDSGFSSVAGGSESLSVRSAESADHLSETGDEGGQDAGA